MIEEGLEFEAEDDPKKAPSTVVATQRQKATYHNTIQMPVIVQLRGGQTVCFDAGQNLGFYLTTGPHIMSSKKLNILSTDYYSDDLAVRAKNGKNNLTLRDLYTKRVSSHRCCWQAE